MAGPSTVSAELTDAARSGDDAMHRGHILRFEARQRNYRVVAGHARNGSEQRRQTSLGEQRGDLAGETAGARRLVNDDAATRLRHRGEKRLLVIGLERGEID